MEAMKALTPDGHDPALSCALIAGLVPPAVEKDCELVHVKEAVLALDKGDEPLALAASDNFLYLKWIPSQLDP